ncbi:MAG: hypothetical protein HRU16_01805 [Planctomycetes bacterium]|nr:hypothetical protein [Planctomycetota bacterium]
MTDSEKPEQNIEDLIGPSGGGENPLDKVRNSLSDEEWQALLDGSLALPPDVGPVVLFLTPDSDEAAELVEWLDGRATVLPQNQARKPVKTPMHEFCCVVISDTFLPIAGGLVEFAEGIPVAVLDDGAAAGPAGDIWRLPRPIAQLQNSDVIESLLMGEHPPGHEEIADVQPVSPRPPERPQGTALPDAISAIRAVLEARQRGESTAEALRRWVVDDPAFHGWVELKLGATGIEVKVGGKEPGTVLRSVGDEIDIGAPIPTTSGSLGPFVGLPISDAWLGFLARNSDEARHEFWRAFGLIPLIEQLMPTTSSAGTPMVEDPEDRFRRLLETRLQAANRRGGSPPGVLLLEFPGGSQQLLAGLSGVLRGSDWLEVTGEQVWILLDQPEQGAASSLTQRLSEALPGLRGAGTIRVSTGIQARECMDRVTQLMRTNDQLHIEEESS